MCLQDQPFVQLVMVFKKTGFKNINTLFSANSRMLAYIVQGVSASSACYKKQMAFSKVNFIHGQELT